MLATASDEDLAPELVRRVFVRDAVAGQRQRREARLLASTFSAWFQLATQNDIRIMQKKVGRDQTFV